MKYKVYLSAILCDRLLCSFIKNCDLGIEQYGVPQEISFILKEEPTQDLINKIIKLHESSKDNKELQYYFANVKLEKIELIGVENTNE